MCKPTQCWPQTGTSWISGGFFTRKPPRAPGPSQDTQNFAGNPETCKSQLQQLWPNQIFWQQLPSFHSLDPHFPFDSLHPTLLHVCTWVNSSCHEMWGHCLSDASCDCPRFGPVTPCSSSTPLLWRLCQQMVMPLINLCRMQDTGVCVCCEFRKESWRWPHAVLGKEDVKEFRQPMLTERHEPVQQGLCLLASSVLPPGETSAPAEAQRAPHGTKLQVN